MGFEVAYFVGALVLLIALIYGTLQYRYRDRVATRAGAEVARDRYEKDQA